MAKKGKECENECRDRNNAVESFENVVEWDRICRRMFLVNNRGVGVGTRVRNIEDAMGGDKNAKTGGYRNRAVRSFGSCVKSISICRKMVWLRCGTSVCARNA